MLSLRALNRATLARQCLLERAELSVPELLERVAGLQSQLPSPPYLGAWTRLKTFELQTLTDLLYGRTVVRTSVMRYTQHLITARDMLWLRPAIQPVLDRAQRGFFGKRTVGLDLDELVSVGRKAFQDGPLTMSGLRARLAERWPDGDLTALAYSVQYLVPLVHVPPTGTWQRGGEVTLTLAEQWLDRPMSPSASVQELVRRYLAAWGPGSVMDIQAWSGLTRLKETVEGMRSELVTFKSPSGTELFDLPGAPLPDPQTPAPVRFLPDYDNLMVSHKDRTRVCTAEQTKMICSGAGGRTPTRPGQQGAVAATVLVDGFVRASWKIQREKGTATLQVEPFFKRLSKKDAVAVEREGMRLLDFAAADASFRHFCWVPV